MNLQNFFRACGMLNLAVDFDILETKNLISIRFHFSISAPSFYGRRITARTRAEILLLSMLALDVAG